MLTFVRFSLGTRYGASLASAATALPATLRRKDFFESHYVNRKLRLMVIKSEILTMCCSLG